MTAAVANRRIVSDARARWEEGDVPDAEDILAQHPELRPTKSLVVELAYEEYCHRRSIGEQVEISQFCRRFPDFQASLCARLEVHDFLESNGHLLEDFRQSQWPEAGEAICGFVLQEELGRGAIGRAFLAEELALARRRVVVKLTPAGCHEAETLGRLKHPHIVPVYSVHEDEATGLTVIVMPYAGRATLQDMLDVVDSSGAAPASFRSVLSSINEATATTEIFASEAAAAPAVDYQTGVLRMVSSLAQALVHAHRQGIYHLDLKPSNVLLTPAGQPMLLDFNLSIDGAATSSLVGGTMPYMSPEQIRALVLEEPGARGKVDQRSDVYSLGLMLYQLLARRYPFVELSWKGPAHRIAARLLELQQAGPTPLHLVDPQLSPRLSRIVAQAVAFDPSQRYATMEALAADLETCFSTTQRLRNKLRQHRRAFLTTAGAVALGAISGGVFLATREPYIERQRQAGWAHFAKNENAEALACFDATVEYDPNDADGLFGRGRAQQRLGKFKEAFESFHSAHGIEKDGRYSACMGFCCSALSRHAEAIMYYERARLEEGFETAELYCSLGKSQVSLTQPTAIASLTEAIRRNPKIAATFNNLALAQIQASRFQDAVESAQRAIGLNARVGFYHRVACRAWYGSGLDHRMDKAIEHLEQAVRLGSSDVEITSLPICQDLRDDIRVKNALTAPIGVGDPAIEFWDPLGDELITQKFIEPEEDN